MPGMIFGVFTRMGVTARTAWTWMWLLPTGYCYVLQAGGIGNDLFGALFPLAGLYFALRAQRGSFADACLAILAAALATSAKMNNLPLILPVALALLPCVLLFLRRPVISAFIAALAILASAIPTACLNVHYCGDWSGANQEALEHWHNDKVLRVANNSVLMAIQNFVPPIFPMASAWNRAVLQHMPAGLHERLLSENEGGAANWTLPEFQWEVNAGLGAGLSVLLLAGLACGGRARPRREPMPFPVKLIFAGVLIAMLAYLASMALGGIGRLAAGYYPLAICGVLLLPAEAAAVRRAWWKALAICTCLLTGLLLVINPSRPLWPALTVMEKPWRGGHLSHALAQVAETYVNNRERSDALAPIRAALPPGESVVGLITADDPETSLWRPFGTRVVVHVTFHRHDRRYPAGTRHPPHCGQPLRPRAFPDGL